MVVCAVELPEAKAATKRPNVILVVTDDVRADELAMVPRLRAITADKGMSFSNAFVTNSLCCPSRTTTLTGRYSGNHGVLTNVNPSGFDTFHQYGLHHSTVATWLKSTGYKTGFFGRYLNGYDGVTIEPGWDQFNVIRGQQQAMSINGEITQYPEGVFLDDVLGSQAASFVRKHDGRPAPLFLAIWTRSAHHPYQPPERYASLRDYTTFPEPPSYDEADVSDKPAWVQGRSPLTEEQKATMLEDRRSRLEMLEGVADTLREVILALKRTGRLQNTFIVFTSDNGLHFGEHRIFESKQTPYDEATRVPLVVRGPGVPEGNRRGKLVLNNDLAPTIAAWARVQPGSLVDGRSFAPLLRRKQIPWRNAFLIEHLEGANIPTYQAARMREHLYVEYESGERELYDLTADPYQLKNIYETADPALVSYLKDRLETLKACSGASSCKTAEDGG